MNVIAPKPPVERAPPEHQQRPQPWKRWLLLFAILSVVGLVAQWQEMDFLEPDEEGKPRLSKERQGKLDKVLREFDEAEQYVLKAERNGYYPCYNCGDDTQIYLYAGQVFYYGSTRKKEVGRYRKSLDSKGLLYVMEYKGTLTECEKRELIQIFKYATLPENLARAKPLIRPPGNKIDH